jgi:hypothetical protein
MCINKQGLWIVVNSKYGASMSQYGATKEATESLIAHLDSQSKLSTARRENQKIRKENEIWKAKVHATERQKLKIFLLVPKNTSQSH